MMLVDSDIQIDQESQEGQTPPAVWPSRNGSIRVEGLTASYAPGLPAVLRNVSFEVLPQVRASVPALFTLLNLNPLCSRKKSESVVAPAPENQLLVSRFSDSSSLRVVKSPSMVSTSLLSSCPSFVLGSQSSRKSRLSSRVRFESIWTPLRSTRTTQSGMC